MGERRHDVFTPLALVFMGLLLTHVLLGFLMAFRILIAFKIMVVVSVLAIAAWAWEEGKFGGLCWFPMANLPLCVFRALSDTDSNSCRTAFRFISDSVPG